MMRKLKLSRAFVPVLATALTLAGCGGSHAPRHLANGAPEVGAKAASPARVAQQCPPGGGYMGCSIAVPSPTVTPTPFAAPSGCKVPDVSSYQGHPSWTAAKSAGICGGIFKAGEYTTDPDASYNNDQLKSLGLWRAMYWFVRNTGCSHEVGQIIAAAHAYGITVVANDLEVPEAAGYAACLVPAEKAAHLIPVNYTSPGAWPGGAGQGNAPLWQAEYGPTLHPFWSPVVAWQCTDGRYGCVTNIPGIGADDVSVDMGITHLGGSPTPPPKVICWGQGATPSTSPCPDLIKTAHADWAKYQSFHAGVVTYTPELQKVQGVIASLEKNSASVNQNYTGPGLAWVQSHLKAATYWAAHYKKLHDGIVGPHTG